MQSSIQNNPDDDLSLAGYTAEYEIGKRYAQHLQAISTDGLTPKAKEALLLLFKTAYDPRPAFQSRDRLANPPCQVICLQDKFKDESRQSEKEKIFESIIHAWSKAGVISTIETSQHGFRFLSPKIFAPYRATCVLTWFFKDSVLPDDFEQIVTFILLSTFEKSPREMFNKVADTLEEKREAVKNGQSVDFVGITREVISQCDLEQDRRRHACFRGFLSVTCQDFIQEYQSELQEIRKSFHE